MNYYTNTTQEVIKHFNSDSKKGLSTAQVEELKQRFGQNKLEETKPPSFLVIFLGQFKDLFTIILFVAAGISFSFGERIDALIILVAVLLNVIISVIQENKAVKTIAELKEVVVFKAKVLRDGEMHQIDASELVPGDIIQLDAGDRVPADARIIEPVHFQAKEALLTGESEPIEKTKDPVEEGAPLAERENMVYQSTVVVNGKARAIVVATGLETEVGKIASLVDETEEEQTPLQKQLARLSIWISVAVIIMSLVVMGTGVVLGQDIGTMFHFAVALAVSAIPEGMVLAVTVILAIGMRQILKRKAVVRELVAAETLGSTTVICSDKTGTMTTGEMVAEKIVTADKEIDAKKLGDQSFEEGVFKYIRLVAALNNDLIIEDKLGGREKILGDTTEKALYVMAREAGCDKCDQEDQYPLVDEIPFDSYVKYMVSAHRMPDEDGVLVLTKGATERVLQRCSHVYQGGEIVGLSENMVSRLLSRNDELSENGYRVIALAFKKEESENGFDLETDDENTSVYLGMVAIRDPIRESIKDSISEAVAAGVEVKMITGDHRKTAQAIANEVGLVVMNDSEIIEGDEFETIQDDESALMERVNNVKVFARVAPVHKLKIVEALQKQGKVVAMTGDGVNDGPALKKADIGVAMGSGTEVAQQTSDIVLRDDNFKTIVAAVEEGRRIFDNIRKVVLYLLSDSFAEVIMIFGSLLLGMPVPILPAQILWINIVDDGFPGMALAFDPIDDEAMDEPPRKKSEPVLNGEMRVIIVIIGIAAGVINLTLFYWLFYILGMSLEKARTVIFTVLAVDSLLYIFSVRSLRHSIFREHIFSNKYLILAVLFGLTMQVVAVYTPFLQPILRTEPLGVSEWGIVVATSLITIAIIEVIKLIYIQKAKKSK